MEEIFQGATKHGPMVPEYQEPILLNIEAVPALAEAHNTIPQNLVLSEDNVQITLDGRVDYDPKLLHEAMQHLWDKFQRTMEDKPMLSETVNCSVEILPDIWDNFLDSLDDGPLPQENLQGPCEDGLLLPENQETVPNIM